jgi:P27 family predicted phage terminase small subunit
MAFSRSNAVIPKHLSPESKAIWEQICGDFALERHALIVLVQALEALDRLRQAQEIIDKDGPVIKDRFGVPKQHPATLLERDARNQFLRAQAFERRKELLVVADGVDLAGNWRKQAERMHGAASMRTGQRVLDTLRRSGSPISGMSGTKSVAATNAPASIRRSWTRSWNWSRKGSYPGTTNSFGRHSGRSTGDTWFRSAIRRKWTCACFHRLISPSAATVQFIRTGLICRPCGTGTT